MHRIGPCAVPGCDRKILAKSMCSLHYGRAASGKYLLDPERGVLTIAEKFWAFVDKTGDCWPWNGGRDQDGYGIFSFVDAGRTFTRRATRFAWELENGPIPGRLFACHECDNPPCVRVSHLFLGTGKQNSADMIAKGRYKNGRARLTMAIAEQMRSRYTGKYGEIAELAREFGISNGQAREICRNESWVSA